MEIDTSSIDKFYYRMHLEGKETCYNCTLPQCIFDTDYDEKLPCPIGLKTGHQLAQQRRPTRSREEKIAIQIAKQKIKRNKILLSMSRKLPLSAKDFAASTDKRVTTIYKWIKSGYLVTDDSKGLPGRPRMIIGVNYE